MSAVVEREGELLGPFDSEEEATVWATHEYHGVEGGWVVRPVRPVLYPDVPHD